MPKNATMSAFQTQAEPIRVLVASSDKHVRSVVAWTLAHDRRFEIVAAMKTGDEVVAFEGPTDVAVLDLAVAGLGILGVIRRLLRRQPAPAIVVIGHANAVYLRHAMAGEGAADYLVIPDDAHELTERVLKAANTANSAGRKPAA